MGGGILWEKKSLGPGPTKLIVGNEEAGFYGEVPTSQFITGDELAKRIGLTAGIIQYSNEPWLKFSYMGIVEFVAKKPFRYKISWTSINNANAVYGDKQIEINGLKYKVRLIKGKTEGKQSESREYNGSICHNSEWNRLMLPIHESAPSNWGSQNNVGMSTEDWNIKYTNKDLLTGYRFGYGSSSWCQEYAGSEDYSLTRGYSDVSDSYPNYINNDSNSLGWRPVLELIGETSEALEAKEKLQIEFGSRTWFNGGDKVAPGIGRDIKTMPTTVEGYKVTITWKSSNLNIMTNDGKRVGKGDVSLIATIRDAKGNTEIKEFKLIII